MTDERTDGVKASELDAIEKAIRGEGCSSISEIITKLNEEQADKLKAEKARDKFATANDEAAKIIGSKGGELGTVKQKLTEAETTISDLTNKLEEQGQTVITPTAPTTEKSIAEQLAEVVGKLSDEQKLLGQALMDAEKDDKKATALVHNPAVRLKFFSDLLNDPDNIQRPKSLFEPEKDENLPSGDEDSNYKRLLAKLKGVTHGPSGTAVTPAGTPRQTQRVRKEVFY